MHGVTTSSATRLPNPNPNPNSNPNPNFNSNLPFVKVPLAFETTGAMGAETQKWWKSVLKLESERRNDVGLSSRREMGMDHTWTANSFVSFWLQSISMAHARMQAESVMLWVGKSQPTVGYGHDEWRH